MLTVERHSHVNTVEAVRPSWPPPAAAPHAGSGTGAQNVADGLYGATAWRPNVSALLILLPLRIFLAAGWVRAAVEKIIEVHWWRGETLRSFVTAQHADAIPLFRPVMDHAVAPAAIVVSAAVLFGELFAGVALATGRCMRVALYSGVIMNVTFVLAGKVNPSAFYLVMEIALLFAIADGSIGATPTKPSRRTLLSALCWIATAGVFVPYIRTMEPKDVIADPAIMLAFLSVITSAGLVYRWVTSGPQRGETGRLGALVRRVDAWAVAQHEPVTLPPFTRRR